VPPIARTARRLPASPISWPIADLTGPRRAIYDVRVKGDITAFLTDLRDQGADWREHEDLYRIFLADDQGPELLFRTARDCGVQVRYLRNILGHSTTISGMWLPHVFRLPGNIFGTALTDLFDLVREGKLKAIPGGEYALSDARGAHEALRSRKTVGKLLLDPGE